MAVQFGFPRTPSGAAPASHPARFSAASPQSARGLAHPKTLTQHRNVPNFAKRPGVRRPSAAFAAGKFANPHPHVSERPVDFPNHRIHLPEGAADFASGQSDVEMVIPDFPSDQSDVSLVIGDLASDHFHVTLVVVDFGSGFRHAFLVIGKIPSDLRDVSLPTLDFPSGRLEIRITGSSS